MIVSVVLLYIIAALLLYSFYKFTFTRPNKNFPPDPVSIICGLAMIVSVVLLYIIAALLLYSFYKFTFTRPNKNFPPGPPRLPIWGSYWFLLALDYKFPARALTWLSQTYNSPLVGLYLGDFPAVVAHGRLVKEVLNKREFDGRMPIILGTLRGEGKKLGIFFTDGPYWHEQRRFSLRYMRDWGFGCRSSRLEEITSDEIGQFISLMRNPTKDQNVITGNLMSLPDAMFVPMINSYLGVVLGRALGSQWNERLREIGRATMLFQRSSDDLGGALCMTPWIRHFMPTASGYAPLCASNGVLVKFIRDIVKECKENFAEEYDQNFFDKYIRRLKEESASEYKSEIEITSSFSDDQLTLVGVDFLFPSASANSVTLSLLIRELMQRPEIQERIQQEIDMVVGRGRLPTLNDRERLPYLEASLREIMRYITIVPLGLPHRAQVDTMFEGYFIPKDTMISVNLMDYHMDREIWGDPENFRPERFLDHHGKLDLKKDVSLPFGAGKRLCAGETFSRQTVFLMAAGLMQNFTFKMYDSVPKLIPGLITMPENFQVKFFPRD